MKVIFYKIGGEKLSNHFYVKNVKMEKNVKNVSIIRTNIVIE